MRNSDYICQVREVVSVQGTRWSSWPEEKHVCYLEPREECFKKEGEVNSVKCYYIGSNEVRMKESVVFVDMHITGGSRDSYSAVLLGSRGKMEVV